MDKINRIKVALVEQSKTGKWIAEQLDKSTNKINEKYNNTTQPDLQTLTKIAQLLNVDRRDLLTPTSIEE